MFPWTWSIQPASSPGQHQGRLGLPGSETHQRAVAASSSTQSDCSVRKSVLVLYEIRQLMSESGLPTILYPMSATPPPPTPTRQLSFSKSGRYEGELRTNQVLLLALCLTHVRILRQFSSLLRAYFCIFFKRKVDEL